MKKYLVTLIDTISSASSQRRAKGSPVTDQIDQARIKLPCVSSEIEVLAAFASLVTKNTGTVLNHHEITL
jgi:hypothetical protein